MYQLHKVLQSLGITFIDGSILKITNSSRLNHVANSEALDGLVLGDAASAVETANRLDVATAVLVTSVISSLGGLDNLQKGMSVNLIQEFNA
jgi:N-acetyl-gamma-glutamylphosphate reductase